MRQLMGHQPVAALRPLSLREGDVVAIGEGAGVNRVGGFVGGGVFMDADVREIATEAGFEKGALGPRQRSPGAKSIDRV